MYTAFMFYGRPFQIYSIRYVFCNFPTKLLFDLLVSYNSNIARTATYEFVFPIVATRLMN